MQNDRPETESERAAWQKGYDIGLAHEGEVPPLMKLSMMRNILARTASPLNEEPAQDGGAAGQAPTQQSDGPLLDLADAAVRRMIRIATRRGYVTYDELDEVLPPEELTVEQTEDVLGQLSKIGIPVSSLDETPLQDEKVATRALERQSDGPSFYRYRADMTVGRMIKVGQKRGYVTYAELNEVLRPEKFTSEQIKDVLRQLSKLNIDVVLSEEDQESLLGRAMHEVLLARASPQDDITEKEPEGGTLIPLVLQSLNDQSLSEGEKRAFALGLLRGLASRGE